MSDVDTKKPDRRHGPGRPEMRKKVITSLKMSELSSAATATLDTPPEEYCPCKDYMEGELSVA